MTGRDEENWRLHYSIPFEKAPFSVKVTQAAKG